MAKTPVQFKILHADLAGHEGIIAAVYDVARPLRETKLFPRVTFEIPSLKKPVREAVRQAKNNNSDVYIEFLPIEAVIENE